MSTEEKFTCPICYEDLDMKDTYHAGCGHRFCKDCWRDSLMNQMMKDELITCIENDCRCLIRLEDIFDVLLQKEEDIKVLKTYLSRFIRKSCEKLISTCPKCHIEFVLETNSNFIECKKCKHQYCKICFRNCHEGKTCEEYESTVGENNEIKQEQWMRENTRKCPHCQRLIHRAESCNNVKCVCGKRFCWLCLADLTEIMYVHFKSDHPTNKLGCKPFGFPEGYVHPPFEDK